MRIEESGIEFDFSAASSWIRHDNALPKGDGNNIWPGVDFRIVESNREIWLELKSWSYHRIRTAPKRHEADRDFAEKLASDGFLAEIVAKFLGTTSYLAWTGRFTPKPTLYLVMLESSRRDSSALLVAFNLRLKSAFPKSAPWGRAIECRVTNLAGFQELLPGYPADFV